MFIHLKSFLNLLLIIIPCRSCVPINKGNYLYFHKHMKRLPYIYIYSAHVFYFYQFKVEKDQIVRRSSRVSCRSCKKCMPYHRRVALLLNWPSFPFAKKEVEDVLQFWWHYAIFEPVCIYFRHRFFFSYLLQDLHYILVLSAE